VIEIEMLQSYAFEGTGKNLSKVQFG